LIIETGTRERADMHFRENALNCQDAKSNWATRKSVTNGRIGDCDTARNAGGKDGNLT
jgi:hypothetical protein